MMTNLLSIQEAVDNFKKLIEDSIRVGGIFAKEAMIRSSKPINQIHEAVKSSLINTGIERFRIYPPLGASSPEMMLAGFIKQKYQDVCVAPKGYIPTTEILLDGLLLEERDHYGKLYTERVLAVNVRSQISSLAKNFDTLYERTIAEAQNLHVRCPKMVLGEVYMIPVHEYDKHKAPKKQVAWHGTMSPIENYIKAFSAINMRTGSTDSHYKYERICLLIVDFKKIVPQIYNTDEELKADGLLPARSTATIAHLNYSSFISELMSIYIARFPANTFN